MKKHNADLALIILAILAASLWTFLLWPQPGELTISFLDVGQGDAIFIETPGGKQVLIDGGPGDAVLEQLGSVMDSLDRSLDLVVLTHAHADHVDGLIPVLDRYDVANILQYEVEDYDSSTYQQWLTKAGQERAVVKQAETGMRIGLEDNIWFDVYVTDEVEKNQNNNSVVLTLWQDSSCLAVLAGDIEAKEESELLASGYRVDCQVLKSPHHGSKTSSSSDFLAAVRPEEVVIMVGEDNKFGHPSPETLELYSNYDVYRTDEMGTIVMTYGNGHLLVR